MARNLRRLLKSQNAKAIRELEAFLSDPEQTVHEARIAFKRIRTLLRLLKKALGKYTYRHFNQAYRSLGLSLSAQRDSWAKQEAIQKLSTETPDSTPPSTDKVAPEDIKAVDDVLSILYTLREELAAIKIRPRGFKLGRKAGLKIYRDGQASMYRARVTDRDEDFHEWRKNAKHLYHLVAILRPIEKNELVPLRDKLYTLTQLLGDDHDLSLLKSDAIKAQDQALAEKIANEQKNLRKEALICGAKLYRTPGRDFIQRMETLWKAFRCA